MIKNCAFIFVFAAVCLSQVAPAEAPHDASTPNTPAPTAPAPDDAYKRIRLSDNWNQVRTLESLGKQSKGVVVLSMNTKCPLLRRSLPSILRLEGELRAQGIQFVGLNAQDGDSKDQVQGHAHDAGISFPVLKDYTQKLTDALNIKTTPEVVLLDADLRVRYRGLVDDEYSLVNTRPNGASQQYLKDAVRQMLAGEKVSVALTETDGCPITSTKGTPLAGVTYAKDIAPILQNKCETCHRPGQAGPFALQTIEDAKDNIDAIRKVVRDREMPPWHADKAHYHFGAFKNDRSLTRAEIEKILAWADTGMAPGAAHEAPKAKSWPTDWELGKPDHLVDMGTDFNIPADGVVEYQYFTVPANVTEDRWVRAAEVHPGDGTVVHHAIVHITGPNGTDSDPKDYVRKLPRMMEIYNGTPANQRGKFPDFAKKLAKLNSLYDPEKAAVLGSYVPGQATFEVPKGTAIHLPKGATLTFELHYTPNGAATKDRTQVGLYFTDKPDRALRTDPMGKLPLMIPAGAPHHQIHNEFLFKDAGTIVSLQPHMHKLAKSARYELILPDGTTKTLLSVPKWDFNWQTTYEFPEPIQVPKGAKIRMTVTFDNTVLNPHNPTNPKPPHDVGWGFQSWEEMMNGWLSYTYDRSAKD